MVWLGIIFAHWNCVRTMASWHLLELSIAHRSFARKTARINKTLAKASWFPVWVVGSALFLTETPMIAVPTFLLLQLISYFSITYCTLSWECKLPWIWFSRRNTLFVINFETDFRPWRYFKKIELLRNTSENLNMSNNPNAKIERVIFCKDWYFSKLLILQNFVKN